MKTTRILAGLILLVAAGVVQADGKMYWPEKVPPNIPYQRALILFKDGTQTLVLQSWYGSASADAELPMGWVVPVPAVPEIATMPADDADRLFRSIAQHCDARRIGIKEVLFVGAFLTLAGGSVLALLVAVLSLVVPLPSRIRNNRPARISASVLSAFLACAVFLFSFAASGGAAGVDVISHRQVGIYDIKVIQSGSSLDLIAWLNENEFAFVEADKKAFDTYVSDGWCFVVAHISPSELDEARRLPRGGLPDPLILRFPHGSPVYPLALTGTGGYKTHVLIYIAADGRFSCDERLSLRYAGKGVRRQAPWAIDSLVRKVEPAGFFKNADILLPYYCKFKDTLTPDQMRQDIVFRPSPSNATYRENIVTWDRERR